MPSEDSKILELEQYQKSDKAAFIIECKRKVSKHILSGFSMSTISTFRSIKISMMYTEVKIIKRFCVTLREHARKTINFKRKKK